MQAIRDFLRPKVFTGHHMIAVMVLFFGTIITVNLIMARFAVTTWSGLVVENSYVASQQFNARAQEAKAIAALGYRVALSADADGFYADLSDRAGAPVSSGAMEIAFRHPVGMLGDRTLALEPKGHGRFAVSQRLPEGEWIATVIVADGDETIYRQAHRIHVTVDGVLTR